MYSEETLNKLLQDIKNDLDSKLMTTQGVFYKYIPKLIAFKRNGFSYSKIYEHGQFSIGKSHFYNLLHKATTQTVESNEGQQQTDTASEDIKRSTLKSKPRTNFSHSDWKAIGIHNDYLISVLQETDLTPEEVKSWNSPNQIQLSTRINEYRMRKMKRK
ncbi:hypothetical protein JL830_16425 [Vibrio parahaemolyticus]|uniref:hypothetical protein n=1 Tax=Vibrio parahaemolyticus TaxID=670 RepID=UPI001869DC2E|nr:hypothetical protein [Vibrio parahaemolyticus]HDM8234337.1 hypothetical protein [Vibrio campbellii]MBE4171698.1 hypothetical protein [Vibrio parahaemolyticus]MCI9700478.1 hypothetical protein [Vibrio parahaemolyticus]MCR9709963.1 hypothetical protein [Vibrio parahaemolyticus]MCR9756598.1 hypothetical protein [Vibrio parahaemolyticus]